MTNEELKANFLYEPETGMLKKLVGRKPYPWRNISSGYLATTFSGETYYLHRLVWQWHHGVVPVRIDHADRNKKNCRIENLRECSSAQNQYNSARKATNRCGAKGVVRHTACKNKPFQAKIVVEGKVRSLGYYASVEEASNAYGLAAAAVAGAFARKD